MQSRCGCVRGAVSGRGGCAMWRCSERVRFEFEHIAKRLFVGARRVDSHLLGGLTGGLLSLLGKEELVDVLLVAAALDLDVGDQLAELAVFAERQLQVLGLDGLHAGLVTEVASALSDLGDEVLKHTCQENTGVGANPADMALSEAPLNAGGSEHDSSALLTADAGSPGG